MDLPARGAAGVRTDRAAGGCRSAGAARADPGRCARLYSGSRIGANELHTQQVMLAYVDAQNEYVQSLHDGNKVHVYAQHLMSSPVKQDGLYWPTDEGQPQSPLGPLIAEARAAGYHPGENAE